MILKKPYLVKTPNYAPEEKETLEVVKDNIINIRNQLHTLFSDVLRDKEVDHSRKEKAKKFQSCLNGIHQSLSELDEIKDNVVNTESEKALFQRLQKEEVVKELVEWSMENKDLVKKNKMKKL